MKASITPLDQYSGKTKEHIEWLQQHGNVRVEPTGETSYLAILEINGIHRCGYSCNQEDAINHLYRQAFVFKKINGSIV